MPFSYTDTGTIGPSMTMAVSFPFISRDHVSVTVDGEEISTSLYEWVNDGLISTAGGFPSGTGRVLRTTPRDGLPGELQGSSVFEFDEVNSNDLALLYVLQELADQIVLESQDRGLALAAEVVARSTADAAFSVQLNGIMSLVQSLTAINSGTAVELLEAVSKANTAVQPTSATNKVPRSRKDGSYGWNDVLYKRLQGGQFSIGATFSIMSHTGPFNAMAGGYWAHRTLDPPKAGITGITTDSQIANVKEIASVGLYNDGYAPYPLKTVSATFTATTAVLSSPLTADEMAELEEGVYLKAATSLHLGKLVSWSANTLVVSGWFAPDNTASGQVPADGQNLLIGVVDKFWTRNTNLLVDDKSYGRSHLVEEMGCGNYGTSYNLFTGVGNQANGLNIVSIGPGDTHWAFLVSRQQGDGSFARGAYISSCSYASYTAGRWGSFDTLTPTYGFLSNYAAGHMAFAVGGSTPSTPNAEKFYVEGTKGDIYTGGMVAIGTPPALSTNANRLIVKTRDAAGTSNGLLVQDSGGASVSSINDRGLGFFAAGLAMSTPSLKITYGAGSPEGVITAAIGSIYVNTNGGTGTTLYVKRSGAGNTGWFAVA